MGLGSAHAEETGTQSSGFLQSTTCFPSSHPPRSLLAFLTWLSLQPLPSGLPHIPHTAKLTTWHFALSPQRCFLLLPPPCSPLWVPCGGIVTSPHRLLGELPSPHWLTSCQLLSSFWKYAPAARRGLM